MPIGSPSAQKIIDAWTGVTDRWIVRRNKNHTSHQWEVLHEWGDPDVVDPDTQKVVWRCSSQLDAQDKAQDLELLHRASAVQAMIVDWNK